MGQILSDKGKQSDGEQNFTLAALPENVVINIMTFLPVNEIWNMRSVCRQLHDICLSRSVWIRYAARHGITLPPTEGSSDFLPNAEDLLLMCRKNPLAVNLIKNGDGSESYNHWEIKGHRRGGGDDGSWHIEKPPAGADNAPEEATESNSCFVTTHYLGAKFQIVDLVKEGLSTRVLDKAKPAFHVNEWVAARSDCSSRYYRSVTLLDARKRSIESYPDKWDEPQHVRRQWYPVKRVITDYPAGARYLKYEHGGQDNQYWAGFYGSKMTGATVTVSWNTRASS